MIVAVTGASGFVGRAVVKLHVAAGDQVRALSRRPAACRQPGVDVFEGDLAFRRVPRDFVAGADVLYHCAGEIRREDLMEAVHVDGTRHLLEQASGAVGRWVQLSSVGVYGPRRDGTITEQTPEAPVGPYERTKAIADGLVRKAHAARRLEAVIVRPSIIFGPGMPNQSLFALINAVNQGLFCFVGPPGASANYIPIDNVVDALLLCGGDAAAAGEVFNVSALTPMEDFIGTIAAALDKEPPRLRLPRLPLRCAASLLGRVPGWPLSPSRVDALSSRAVYPADHIASTLGFRPRMTVHHALRAVVEGWRAAREAGPAAA
jgi:nucleoside-diphosphate-sugar epimerase